MTDYVRLTNTSGGITATLNIPSQLAGCKDEIDNGADVGETDSWLHLESLGLSAQLITITPDHMYEQQGGDTLENTDDWWMDDGFGDVGLAKYVGEQTDYCLRNNDLEDFTKEDLEHGYEPHPVYERYARRLEVDGVIVFAIFEYLMDKKPSWFPVVRECLGTLRVEKADGTVVVARDVGTSVSNPLDHEETVYGEYDEEE